MGLMFAILLALGTATESPTLVVRASPRMSMASPGGGCATVLLVAEIRGPEVEKWYCPAVAWEFPDGTRATEESDCPPFDQREEFPRFWSRRICAPPTPPGIDAWEVGVTLTRAGRVVAHQVVSFVVH